MSAFFQILLLCRFDFDNKITNNEKLIDYKGCEDKNEIELEGSSVPTKN